jgi:hypothetical protein
MRKLFVHHPLFRILSPVFSGVMVYLLILLINNNVVQLQEQFLGEELYICIGLSYLIQEFSRLLLILFKRLPQISSAFLRLLIQVVISLSLCIVLVTITITIYFDKVLNFAVTTGEIITFNTIFCVITFIYILLFISHQYLYKINTEKLSQEQLMKQNIEDDFRQFKKGINPNLLFESFEALLLLIKTDKEKADDFIDHLATIYRYILSGKDRQLVVFNEELNVIYEFEKLLNYLPYRNILVKNEIKSEFLTVPGSLLFLIEKIVKKTIPSNTFIMEIVLTENTDFYSIEYTPEDKITESFQQNDLSDFIQVFEIYSQQKISIDASETIRKINIPKLQIKS